MCVNPKKKYIYTFFIFLSLFLFIFCLFPPELFFLFFFFSFSYLPFFSLLSLGVSRKRKDCDTAAGRELCHSVAREVLSALPRAGQEGPGM